MYGVLGRMFASPQFWLTSLLLVVAAILPDLALKAWRDLTTPHYILMAKEKGSCDRRHRTQPHSGKVRPTFSLILMILVISNFC